METGFSQYLVIFDHPRNAFNLIGYLPHIIRSNVHFDHRSWFNLVPRKQIEKQLVYSRKMTPRMRRLAPYFIWQFFLHIVLYYYILAHHYTSFGFIY